jgi:hypothetical protein
MGYDEVESSKLLGTSLAEVHRVQADVPQAQLCHESLTGSDRPPRQIKTDKLALRQLESHSDNVTAYPATQFEHATSVDRRRLDPTEKGHGREPVRMSLRKNRGRIQNFIVRTYSASGGLHTPLG